MCTVSFVSSNGKTIITSNRDEKVLRPSAIEPKNYQINTKNVFFPKDPKAGGTWFAVDENSNVLVLLNGAEEKHILKEKYNRSRGLIVLELIGETSPLENAEHGLVINRNDVLKTLSITQAVVEKNKVQMTHYDLIKNDSFNHAFIII